MTEITVGLPVYNGSETLERAFEQMLAQTYRDFRLVVSDNASTDETQSICEKYARRDNRIVYRRREPRVPGSENFRSLLMGATTPYFMWISHDDIWHPEFIAKCMERFRDHPKAVCVVPRSNHIFPDGTVRIDQGTAPLTGDPAQRLRQYLKNLDGNHRIYGLYRTEALRKSFPDGAWYFAYDWLVVALSTLEGEHDEVPEVLFKKFVNPAFHYHDPSYGFETRDRWERVFPCLRFSRELHSRAPAVIWRACIPQISNLILMTWAQRVQYFHPWTRRPISLVSRIQKSL
jgi:glycosyltransferase involved in cell wall biosynthesis